MAISSLSLFNLLIPKDFSSHRVAGALAYGPHLRQRLDLYAPRRPTSGMPVILFLYGGSWNDGDRANYAFVGRALAAAGYLVAVADYRVQPEAEYPVFLDDCAAAFAWLAENAAAHGGDANRIVVAGHSAGAYNAAMLALHPRYRAALGEGLCGVVGLSGPYDFFPLDGVISMRTFGAVPDPRDTQPINHVRAGLPPFWLGTGNDDTLVLPRNSVALAAAIEAEGGTAELHRYDGLAHAEPLIAISWPLRRRAPVLADMRTFLERVTQQSQQSVAA